MAVCHLSLSLGRRTTEKEHYNFEVVKIEQLVPIVMMMMMTMMMTIIRW